MRRTAARAARASRSAREYLPKAFPSLDADDVARELFDDARAVATFGASDEATLAKCLDALLKKAEAGEVDKQTFPAIGLKVKKANAASGAWTPAVQAKFVAVVQAEPPSFG